MNLLFDLDGTLTDPRDGIIACIKHGLLSLGEPSPPDMELERFIGPPLHETFVKLLAARHVRAPTLASPRFLESLTGLGAELYVATSKPLIEHILRSARLRPVDTVMIGDREHDILGARVNNVRGVGVSWGYGSRAGLAAAGADQLCEQPSDLSLMWIVA